MTAPVTSDPSPTGKIPETVLPTSGDGVGRGRRSRRSRNWFWIVVGWPALLCVAFVLVLRWQEPHRPLVIALIGLTPLLVGPLAIGVLSAWWGRSPTLRGFAAVVAATFLYTVSPVDAAIGCGADTAPDAITVYSANVLVRGGRTGEIAASIVDSGADVVVMQEVQWPFLKELSADPRLSDFQYWSHHTEGAPTGRPVFSRWPILAVEVENFVGSKLVHVTIDGPQDEFTISNIHTLAPAQAENVSTWHAQFAQLQQIDRSTPRILAGDFNATRDHQPLRQLLNTGWTDSHERKGCGFDATWPVDTGLPFAVYRLDHVLVTEHFEVLDVRFGDPAGSDHKPVITELRVR